MVGGKSEPEWAEENMQFLRESSPSAKAIEAEKSKVQNYCHAGGREPEAGS